MISNHIGVLWPEHRGAAGPESSFVVRVGVTVADVVDELVWRPVERERDKTRAAKILGIGRRPVYTHLEHHDGYPTNGGSNSRPAVGKGPSLSAVSV